MDHAKRKVTELKELLKERGIPSTGLSRKQQIVEALDAYDATQMMEKRLEAEHVEGVEAGQGAKQVSEDGGEVEEAHAEEVSGNGKEVVSASVAEEMEAEEAHAETEADVQGEGNEESLAEAKVVAESGSAPLPTEDVTAEPATSANEPTVQTLSEPLTTERLMSVATPPQASSAPDTPSSDTRKRKRRSRTPPPSEDSVQKKLKMAEEEVVILPEDRAVEHVQEDHVVEDAPVAVDTAAAEDKQTVMPSSVSDDVADVRDQSLPMDTELPAQEMETNKAITPSPPPRPPVEEAGNNDNDNKPTSPAIHPATHTLYIRNLVRPLQPLQLQDHLAHLATPPNPSSENHNQKYIRTFHLDTLRTHAFVTFSSLSASARVRSALHGQIWPDEPARKALWVDFVPDEEVEGWIDTELKYASGGRRHAKKWEVVYHSNTGEERKEVKAELREVGATASSAAGPMRQPSNASSTIPPVTGAGEGMPNAPLGPRSNRPSVSNHHQPPPPTHAAPPTKKPPPPPSASFDVLDQTFPSTTAKPKIYYLPCPKTLVDRRLDELDALTSRAWRGARGVDGGEGELRRYTFEDGEKLVDNGVDFGGFGRGPRGGFGGGGRGYRGDRGGYRGRGR